MKTAYRVFLTTVFLAMMFETGGIMANPLVQLGFDFHSDLTAVIHAHIIVSIFEICIVLAIILWLMRGRSAKRTVRFQRGSLVVPVLAFLVMLAFGVAYGQLQPSPNLTEALWEVRGFLMMTAGYFLLGMYVQGDEQANHLVWVLLTAASVLTLNNLWIAIGYSSLLEGNDLAYDHVDSVVIGVALILCIAIITYGGTRNQRRFAIAAIPVFTVCLMMMKRRAAFPVVGIGLIIVVVFLLRLRPRLFWKYVPPLTLLCVLYLVAFWNNTGTLGQPARALSSQFTPDPRDYGSNLYRAVEKTNIEANIAQAPLTGLGFGQPYVFYYPMVADLSAWWPFYHYETHNAILWVWMKDGAIGFTIFWWLLGRGVYDGCVTVETQREEWALVDAIRARFARRRKHQRDTLEAAAEFEHILYRPVTRQNRRSESRKSGALTLNVPHWERSDEKRSLTARRTATLALLVTAICTIPMQVVYSYVDLGLVSERDMLLVGIMLGVIARGTILLGITDTLTRQSKRRRRSHTPGAVPLPASRAEESMLAETTEK